VFPVRYGWNLYILFRRNSVFKGLTNEKFERLWKEMVMAYFKVLFWHLPKGKEEKYENPQSGVLVSKPRLEPTTSQI
jgi:hypothetical protein